MDEKFNILVETLQSGGIAVVRTDTLYGIVALAAHEQAVNKVFAAKSRDIRKQCIVLIADANDAASSNEQIARLTRESAKPITVIVPVTNQPTWLLHGGDSLAYRVVGDPFLQSVIKKVGPIIAPSANPEGLPPAHTIAKAQEYFGDAVDAYIDGGEVPADVHASIIVKIYPNGLVTTLRS